MLRLSDGFYLLDHDEMQTQSSDPAPAEDESEIIVVAKRPKHSGGLNPNDQPEANIPIVINLGDTNPTNTGALLNALRSWIGPNTNFDISKAFSLEQIRIIKIVLQTLAEDPLYSAKFEELNGKSVDVNIISDVRHQYTTSDRPGATVGFNSDGTVPNGGSLAIYIRPDIGGEPIGLYDFTIDFIHEMLHAFGDPALSSAIDQYDFVREKAIYTTIASRIGSGFGNIPDVSVGFTAVPALNGTVAAGALPMALIGSEGSETFNLSQSGSLVYSGDGDDRLILSLGGQADEVFDLSGSDTIVLPGAIALSSVQTRWTSTNSLELLINGYREAEIHGAGQAGAVEYLEINGLLYSPMDFLGPVNNGAGALAFNVERKGAFGGGTVASVAVNDPEGDALAYRIVGVSGGYSGESWSIDPATGAISANFAKPDIAGTQFTFIRVVASEGVNATSINVTLRWTYSKSTRPELGSTEADQEDAGTWSLAAYHTREAEMKDVDAWSDSVNAPTPSWSDDILHHAPPSSFWMINDAPDAPATLFLPVVELPILLNDLSAGPLL